MYFFGGIGAAVASAGGGVELAGAGGGGGAGGGAAAADSAGSAARMCERALITPLSFALIGVARRVSAAPRERYGNVSHARHALHRLSHGNGVDGILCMISATADNVRMALAHEEFVRSEESYGLLIAKLAD